MDGYNTEEEQEAAWPFPVARPPEGTRDEDWISKGLKDFDDLKITYEKV